ncbi:hypothetical protein C8J56DRAFT_920300 [Mycena floridula]|nr:hypothetical protein C8J56DRAFT_920300 [Mycena floridula]
MGQRHQAFVIARVVPHGEKKPAYRCIAAVHHQWCYGRLPLKALDRFLKLVKQPNNAEIVLEEIQLIQGKYGRHQQTPEIVDVPCPFTSFLLSSAWAVDLEDPYYYSGVKYPGSVLPANMGSFEGDNNDGITIIDVTDLAHPSYCFNLFEPQVLTAEDYVRQYYSLPTEKEMKDERTRLLEEDVLETVKVLKDIPLIPLKSLAEAWPSEYAAEYEASSDAADNSFPESEKTTIPSLSDLAMQPALEQSLADGDTGDIEQLIWLPGKSFLIQEALRAKVPFPESAFGLLAQVIAHELSSAKVIDLSSSSLTDAQVDQLLSSIPHDVLATVEDVNLSHSATLGVETLRRVITHIPKLKHITLFDTAIKPTDIESLIVDEPQLFKCLESLIHPSLFRFVEPITHPNGFSFIGSCQYKVGSAYLPIWTPATAVQCLTDFLSCLVVEDADMDRIISTMAVTAAFGSAVRPTGVQWADRRISSVPASSMAGLDGEGWTFVITGSAEAYHYGFVKVDKDVMQKNGKGRTYPPGAWRIHDLKGFLDEMVKEGRPSPDDAAVKTLDDIISTLISQQSKVVPEGVNPLAAQMSAAVNSPEGDITQGFMRMFQMMLNPGFSAGASAIPGPPLFDDQGFESFLRSVQQSPDHFSDSSNFMVRLG